MTVDGFEFLHLLVDRHDDHLNGGEFWRKDEAVVVGVGHNERAHQTGGNAPRGCPYVFLLVLGTGEGDIECLGEVLTQEVAGTRLECLAVLHHGFNGEGIDGACETLVG